MMPPADKRVQESGSGRGRTRLRAWYFALLASSAVGLVILDLYARLHLGGSVGASCTLAALGSFATPAACADSISRLLASESTRLSVWLWFDNLFVAVYTAMFILGALELARCLRSRAHAARPVLWLGLAALAVLAVLAVLTGVVDYVENAALLASAGEAAFPAWLPAVTAWKWRLIAVNLLATLATLVIIWRSTPARQT